MSQVLHIFKKDIRHLWPEILASLVLTALFVKTYPSTWAVGYRISRLPDIIATIVVVLVPISWWLMTTRLIHDESMVGERQFWITRPYRWKKLLAAKLLFLSNFLYLPILIAHVLLLRIAGFHPTSFLPGLLFNLLLIFFILVMPTIALATVTSSFAKAILTLLGVIVGVIVLAGLSSLWGQSIPDVDGGVTLGPVVVVALGLSVILVQFATRNVRLSRWLLVAAAVMIAAGALDWPQRAFVPMEYPQSSPTSTPVNLAFDPNPSHHLEASPSADDKKLSIRFPIAISGVASGTAIQAESVKVLITAPDGRNWSSSWQSARQYFTREAGLSTINVDVDRTFLEKVKDLPVQVRLTWALSRLRAGKTGQAIVSDEEFAIPGNGICAEQGKDYNSSLACRFPMRQPRLTRFAAMWSRQPCSQTQSPDATSVFASGWIGTLDNSPAEFGITSVWTSALYFPGQGFAQRDGKGRTYLCPGTPISFTEYALVDRSQLVQWFPEMKLPYRIDPPFLNLLDQD
jgi:hypothetical protein